LATKIYLGFRLPARSRSGEGGCLEIGDLSASFPLTSFSVLVYFEVRVDCQKALTAPMLLCYKKSSRQPIEKDKTCAATDKVCKKLQNEKKLDKKDRNITIGLGKSL